MKNVEITKGSAILKVSQDEISIIINCMNETLEAVEDWEFQTRLGVSPDEVKKMIQFFLGVHSDINT